MAQLYVGIDLGTTNSTVSVIQTDERRLRQPIEHLRSIPILQYDKDFKRNHTRQHLTCQIRHTTLYILKKTE